MFAATREPKVRTNKRVKNKSLLHVMLNRLTSLTKRKRKRKKERTRKDSMKTKTQQGETDNKFNKSLEVIFFRNYREESGKNLCNG